MEYYSSGRIDPGIAAAEKKVKDIGQSLRGLDIAGSFNSAFDSIASSVVSKLVSVAEMVGATLGAGMGLAVREAMRFNEEMENAQVQIAAVSVATGTAGSMGAGLRLASGVLVQMRKDAAALPGSFEDLRDIMSFIMPAVGHAGVNPYGAEVIAKNLMVAAKMDKISGKVAGREYAAMVAGNAKTSMPLFQKMLPLLDEFGIHSTTDFNKITSMRRRMDLANIGIAKLANPAMEVLPNTWQTIKETAIDNIRLAVGAVGGDLFQRIKDRVKNFNDFAGGARGLPLFEKMGIAGQQASAGLVRAFDYVFGRGEDKTHGIERQIGLIERLIERWSTPLTTFFSTMRSGFEEMYHRASPFLTKVSDTLRKTISDPGLFKKIEHGVIAAAAIRAGSGMLGAAANAGGALMPFVNTLLQSGAGAATIAGGAGIAAGALALLAIAVGGAVSAVLDVESAFHGVATGALSGIIEHGTSFGKHMMELGEKLKPFAEGVGTLFLTGIEGVVFALDKLTWTVNAVIEGFSTWNNMVAGAIGLGPKLHGGDNIVDKKLEQLLFTKRFNTYADREKDDVNKPPKHNVNVNVKIDVRSYQDPRRIARETVKHIEDFAKRSPKSDYSPGAQYSQ